MNIVIRPYGSELCYCRPDTTWEREGKDFYSPECVESIDWVPILFVRISKAGKCIGKKFASRYYDAFNFGALLYCNINDRSTAYTSCADHTSLLPFPLYNMVVLENERNAYIVRRDSEDIFSQTGQGLTEVIEDTLCKASMLTTLRIGDIVAIELKEVTQLAERSEGEITLQATYCGTELFNNKIIF